MENIVKRDYYIDSRLYKDFRHTLELTKDTENHVVELCMHWYITFISDIINGCENNGNKFYGKAIRKIPQWASKPNQYNHKIIRAYFTATEHNNGKATIELMEKLCSDETHEEMYVPTFKTNYDQMKFDSEKSNGKVFEDDGNEVWIWGKVKELLLFYKSCFCNAQKYSKRTQKQ